MKNTKKLVALLLSLVMMFSLVACNTSTDTKDESAKESAGESTKESTEESKGDSEETTGEKAGEAKDFTGKLVGMVTDTGGVDDQSFNQSSWKGLQELKKDTKAEVTYVQSKQDSDYIPNINQLLDKNADLSWGIGFLLGDAVKTASQQAPDKQFAIIDMAYDKPETLPNVTGVVFKAQEPSYLVGYLAAHQTKTNKVGFIGGKEGVVISQFDYGFRAGVEDAAKELGKKVEVIVQYANSFNDQAIGKSIATKMFANGADIVFHAAGGVGIGVIEAAREAKKFAIGVDQDQSYLAPENVLTSAMKRVDKAIYDLSSRILSGEKVGGTTVVYASEGGFVGIPEWTEKSLYPKDVYDKVMVKQQEIVDGKLVPPFNAETFKEYQSKQQ
ncbi:BMP family ABC transporter substrate-binding protein [Helcococcus kunzii]|uniref:BMP family ABC transporter substrate-binding protein n=1 Tax=Helcococcus kunzii TaxID=40091 RepID=UPI001BAEDA96|nr:BMP family ABC transporter substrate-binding protein [Helcococcus kunzii]QUY64070.1 BMP family ABC transporter substrate-binding protein [Helcococcus kunzii]